MSLRGRTQRGEQGAILVLSAVGMVIALISSALAIDIGRLAQAAREDQKIADMAALDAIRGVPGEYQRLAEESAARNGFPLTSAGYGLVAYEGTKVNGACQAVPGAGSACVTVTSPHSNNFPFVGGRKSMTRAGMAANSAFGGFMLGSSLASFDTARSTVLNRFMGGILRGSGLSLSGVSWSGLAGGNITLEALRFQLASMGYSVGTVDELLDTNVNMANLMQASAQALALQGPTAAAQLSALNALRTQITSTSLAVFKLGRFIEVAQGADTAALASKVNIFQLATAAAQVANGSNLVSVDPVGVNVPGVLATKASLKVIEAPKFYFGPVGNGVSTSQIELTLTPDLDLPISLAGLVGARVRQTLPVKMVGAGAVGTLTGASCATSPGITVTVDPSAFSLSAAATLDIVSTVAFIEIPVLRVPVSGVNSAVNGAPVDLFFSYPSQFPPPLGSTTTKHAGSNPVGLRNLLNLSAGTPVVLNSIAAPLVGTVGTTLVDTLKPLLQLVDTDILSPLLQALGTSVGSADVTAISLQCDTPALTG